LIKKELVSIYFGGGTPSLFPEAAEMVLSWFSGLDDVEVTFEMNPEDVTDALLNRLKEIGINRISLGIQSLDDSELICLGREKSTTTTIEQVSKIIPNLSIDLMYDIPGQNRYSFEKTLKKALTLPITHISLYNLTIEPHTVFHKKRPKMPSEKESFEMHKLAIQEIEKAGLERYEISAFAAPGFESRHNVGYWTSRPFLGLGPSAFSYLDGTRSQNIPNIMRYDRLLKEGKSPTHFSEKLSPDLSQNELLGVEIRLTQGVNLEIFEKKHGKMHSGLKKSIKQLIDMGLAQKKETLALTEKGLLFYDSAMEILI